MYRFLAVLAAALLLFASGSVHAAPPSLDGNVATASSTSAVISSAPSLTTTGSNDAIGFLACMQDPGAAPAVKSISSTHTTSWVQRGAWSFSGANGAVRAELWVGQAASALTGEAVTMTVTPDTFIAWSSFENTDAATLNTGATSFNMSTPSGFSAWDASGSTTFDSSNSGAALTLSGGNLIATHSGSNGIWGLTRSTTSKTSGKYYFEIKVNTFPGVQPWEQNFGVVNSAASLTNYSGSTAITGADYASHGGTDSLGGGTWYDIHASAAGSYIGIAVDVGSKLMWARSSLDTNHYWNGSSSANPSTGAGGFSTSMGVNGIASAAWGISGVHSLAAPFDTNGTLPNEVGGSTGTGGTLTFSTTEANDYLVAFWCGDQSGAGEPGGWGVSNNAPTGWTKQFYVQGTGAGSNTRMSMITKSVTATQSSATVSVSTTPVLGLVDAFTADAPPAPACLAGSMALLGVGC